MIAGTVIFYNAERGFGYIKQGNGENDVRFLHESLKRAGLVRVSEGQQVRFDTHNDPISGKITVKTIEIGESKA